MTKTIVLFTICIAAMTSQAQSDNTFRPRRISQTASFTIPRSISEVFPLFGPVREKDWATGWNPVILYGNADVELHMLFETSSRYPDEGKYLWAVTQFNPEAHQIEYTVTAKDRIWFITVRCVAEASKTIVHITYTYTGLTEAACLRNEESMKKMFALNLQDWAEEVNQFFKSRK